MDIKIAEKEAYQGAIRDLFPKGDYWDRQFADPKSDINLFCKAKAQGIVNFRQRMNELLQESKYETAVETIGDWERVLLEYKNNNLSLPERRKILNNREISAINRITISTIASSYGLTLIDILFPFKPSFFGFSQFGCSVFSNFTFFSVFYIILTFQDKMEARKHITQLLMSSSFGQACFGKGQFLARAYFNKNYASRVFTGMKTLHDFEKDVSNKLLANNIVYFLYK